MGWGGRPTKWSQDLEDKAIEYISNFREHGDEIPSHVGICCAIGVAKSTLYAWAEEKRGQFSDILSYCNEVQETQLVNNGLNGKFNSNIVKLALGKHGYHEKQETKNETTVNVKTIELVAPSVVNDDGSDD